jgi:hypothetical protein
VRSPQVLSAWLISSLVSIPPLDVLRRQSQADPTRQRRSFALH